MQIIPQDFRYGLRLLRSTPGFTAVAVLTLALGIAVNTAVFSWVNAILLNPIPGITDHGSVVIVETFTAGHEPTSNMSWRDYQDYRDHLKLVSGIAVAKHAIVTVGPDDNQERVWGEMVSGNYFSLLGVKMAAGRGLLEDEGRDKAVPVAVISHRIWRRHFGLDRSAVGKTIKVNRQELMIVGVAADEFHGGTPGVVYDVWVPFPMQRALGVGGSFNNRSTRDCTATLARLRLGVSVEQARAEVGALADQLAAIAPRTNAGIGATALRIAEGHNGAQGILRGPLRILFAMGGLVLLIVCANVANLLLARAVTRQREFAVRLSLGSSRRRLIRQVLTETLILAAAGTGSGILLALWIQDALTALLPLHDTPLSLTAPIDPLTVAFISTLCVFATVVSGLAPALLAGHSDLAQKLKQGGRSDSAGAGSAANRLRKLLIVSEVALACVALIGAGLFLRSFSNASAIQPGFNVSNVLVSNFYLAPAGYTAKQEVQFCRRLRDRLATLPRVVEASYSDQAPLTMGRHPVHLLEVEGFVPSPADDMYVQRTFVSPGHFSVMGIPLLEGRDFTDHDATSESPVLVVNQSFARQFFRGQNPVGRKVRFNNNWCTVIGMVKDTKYNSVTETPIPYFYANYDRSFSTGLPTRVYIRTQGNPTDLIPAVRREVLGIDPKAASFFALSLAEQTSASLFTRRAAAALLSALALMALVLAAIGLYGVMSYSVGRRTQELGIRMALGASPGQILGMVVRGGLQLSMAGAAIGVFLAISLTPLVSEMLVNVRAADPVVLGAAVAFLGAVAGMASFLPARRATRVDPMTALRSE
jgi:predicted permease